MRLITVAIHTYDRAVELKNLLEKEGIQVTLQNVNLETPVVSSGVRVRIHESDLPFALRIIENTEVFRPVDNSSEVTSDEILVPVDFSDYSMRAAQVAFDIAARHNLRIVFLHSYINPFIGDTLQLTDALTFDLSAENEARRQTEQAAEAQMSHFVRLIREQIKNGIVPDIKFSTKVVEGVPEDSIDEYAKLETPYLVVMGTRGSDHKAGDMIGSVTAEVLDRCRVSVLSVPETFTVDRETHPVNILFLSNLDQSDILALDTMSRIYSNSGAKIILTGIIGKKRPFDRSDPEEQMQRLLRYCRTNFKEYEFSSEIVTVDKTLDSLVALASRTGTDLIVLPNKKRKRMFGRLLNPGLARRLVVNVDLPMLVIRV